MGEYYLHETIFCGNLQLLPEKNKLFIIESNFDQHTKSQATLHCLIRHLMSNIFPFQQAVLNLMVLNLITSILAAIFTTRVTTATIWQACTCDFTDFAFMVLSFVIIFI